MRYVKTYGIYGLLEWHGTVQCGGITMKLSFTNGSTTAYGVSPATFTTKDEATQFVIENSDKFKSGKIKLINRREFVGAPDKKVVPVVPKVTTPEPPVTNPEPPVTNPEPPKDEEGAGADAGSDAGADAGSDAGAGDGDNSGVIKVSDKSEAIDWLKSHFPENGYTATKLRTKEAFLEACKDCGVSFEW